MNWKTSALGVLAILSAALPVAQAVIAGQPVPDMNATLAAIMAGLGLIFAKDGSK